MTTRDVTRNVRSPHDARHEVTSNAPTSTILTHDRFGDLTALRLGTRDDLPLAPGEVRIAVTVAGLNPVDWQILESESVAAAFGITTPTGFGNDFAGAVTEVGADVIRWAVGDRVFGGARGSAVATSMVLDQHHPSLHRTPVGVPDLQAGVLDIAGRTAAAVADALAAEPGSTVLVGAAGGGVGSVLTQLLVLAGVRVIGTGSPSSADHIRSLGAEPVTYGPAVAVADAVRALGVGPLSAAADLHGTATALAALELGVAPDRIVTIESEDPPSGVLAVNGSDARPDALARLTGLIASHALSIPIAAVFWLEDAVQAVARQRARHAHGKVAIHVADRSVLVDGLPASSAQLEHFATTNDGHFTSLQVRAGRVRGLDAHLSRLTDAHRRLFDRQLATDTVRSAMRAAVRDNSDGSLRVVVTALPSGRPSVLTVLRPPLRRAARPISLTPVRWTRAFPEIKHLGTFPQVQLHRDAVAAGQDDALLIADDGAILETTIANVAFMRDDVIVWPEGPSLPGTTWRLLEPLLHVHGLRSEHRLVTLSDLRDFDAAVTVNSTGIEPVGRIADKHFATSADAAERLDAIYRTVPASPI